MLIEKREGEGDKKKQFQDTRAYNRMQNSSVGKLIEYIASNICEIHHTKIQQYTRTTTFKMNPKRQQ